MEIKDIRKCNQVIQAKDLKRGDLFIVNDDNPSQLYIITDNQVPDTDRGEYAYEYVVLTNGHTDYIKNDEPVIKVRVTANIEANL